ncbi:MAG: elongation factor P [Bdellovibrionaceae bacterium]|nr:elongation factor P [Pseudobdellovibrionaceae bacterium]
MYTTSDFKKGLKLLIDGQPYVVTDFQHVKPGKGNQFTRTKLRNMITGSNLEKTYKSGEKFEVPDVMTRDCNYLYKDESGYVFMDKENYEQYIINPTEVGDAANFLTENLAVTILFFNSRAIGVDVPTSVYLKVTQTDPGLKGNTVSGATKPATLETGHVVQVPLHISEGDVLKIDSRDGSYIERSNN